MAEGEEFMEECSSKEAFCGWGAIAINGYLFLTPSKD